MKRVVMLIAGSAAVVQGSKPVLYGYDVVEYFSLDSSAQGVMGKEDFAADLLSTDKNTKATSQMTPSNFTFWFKNAANKATFEADPWKYAPQWGGF